jgi:hypothetical protein
MKSQVLKEGMAEDEFLCIFGLYLLTPRFPGRKYQ